MYPTGPIPEVNSEVLSDVNKHNTMHYGLHADVT